MGGGCDIDSVHKTNKQAIYNNKNMKVRLMTKVSAATLISAIACSIFTGCTEKDLYNPERGKTELKPESEYFDFATTAQVAFDVNYGKIAGGALLM